MTDALAADVAIIGAGPVGLFAVFELGMLQLSSVLIDALDEVGGQCAALYPEKPIFDIPAHPAIEAGALVARWNARSRRSGAAPARAAGDAARGRTGAFTLGTDRGDTVAAKAVVIAAGAGAFGPNRPPLDGLAAFEASGAVQYYVRRREELRGKRVVIAGGGDSRGGLGAGAEGHRAHVAVVHRRAEIPRRAGERGPARRSGGAAARSRW